jgi:hypothetical protein
MNTAAPSVAAGRSGWAPVSGTVDHERLTKQVNPPQAPANADSVTDAPGTCFRLDRPIQAATTAALLCADRASQPLLWRR